MTMMKPMRIALGLVIAVGVGACDDTGTSTAGDGPLTLSFVVPESGAAGMFGSSLVLDTIAGGGHTLDVQEIQLTFSEIVFERTEGALGGDSDGDSDADSDSDGAANERFRQGPTVVTLPLNGGVITPFTDALPVGSYEEIELDVVGARIVGTFDGEPFNVSVPAEAELDIKFASPFDIDSSDDRINITVAVDALSWFRNSDGTPIDPRLLNTDEELLEDFEDRVRESFDAFEDSDRDGDDQDSDSDGDSDSDDV